MTLEDLVHQQQQELEAYKVARDITWNKMKEEHGQIAHSMGGAENVSAEIRQRFDNQITNYQKEWPMYTGERYRALTEQHQKQRDNINGKPKPESQPKEAKPKNDNNPLSDEKQAKLQKIIAQQQAIHNRQQEQKRKR